MMPKRILLIIPEMSMGGAQRSLSKLSLELARHHWVGLVIFNRNDDVAYEHGGELISLNVVPSGGVAGKLKAFLQRVLRLRRLKKEFAIDISISFLEGADYINVLSKRKDKVILSVRGSKLHDENMERNWKWLRVKVLMPWLYRKADTVVAVNHGIASEMQAHFGLPKSKLVTVGNFYDIGEITRLSLEPKEGNVERLYADPVLITTGRLAPEKGLRQILQVFHGLKVKNKKLHWVVVGEGPEREPLLLDCSKFGLTVHVGTDFETIPDVLLAGTPSNVFNYLKGATVYLMNSSNEGFPNGLAEAMICGVPVVSSDCPYGPREILAPEFPFTAPVQEPYIAHCGVVMPLIRKKETVNVWIKTVGDLLESETDLKQFASNARERISQFDQKVAASAWHHLLEDRI